ncbi:DGQHR domain-containing protein [Salinicoccus luteus]|uniref:DGQHR domain-containing protein n=1 Tax=Salinicoccus luteus TaxID=367840 RepID=UPI0004E236AF|nr:DGQHR domain-containing protein [Salinicoccus luteus]
MKQYPFIRVSQKNEFLYLTKLDVGYLRDTVSFHFREPYVDTEEDMHKVNKYIKQLENLGIESGSDVEGVQRRTQIKRIKDIRNFVESSQSSLFPSSIILACNSLDENQLHEVIDGEDVGILRFPKETIFTVIDGQHRLAGLLSSDIEDFELPVTLFFNISLSMSTKIFSEINGNQKAVNKSLLYDLYNNINEQEYKIDKEYSEIARNLNQNDASPLYKQIKMLGVGDGSVSQAFFIENAKKAIEKTDLKDATVQEKFTQLYKFFRGVQTNFPEEWPIDYNNETKQNGEVQNKQGQLAKTNGIGALLLLFPEVYCWVKFGKTYKEIISHLDGYDWNKNVGSGNQAQRNIYKELSELLKVKLDRI